MASPPKPSSRTRHDCQRRLLRVIQHVQGNLDQPLPMEDLASIACFSLFHFSRFFKGMTGESVRSYIQRLRLERAASHLALSRKSVTVIGLEAGYETHEAFTRAFGRHFNLSPTAYRKRSSRRRKGPLPNLEPAPKPGKSGGSNHSMPNPTTMEVRLVRRSPMRVAYMRHVGAYSKVGDVWEKLSMELGREGRLGGGETFLGVCYDDPEVTHPRQLRYDACVSVGEEFQPRDGIGVQFIQGGLYAVYTHVGPYQKLGSSYERLLGRWLPQSTYELRAAPCFEVYLNSPENTPRSELLTDIYAPLQRWRSHRL